MPIVTGTNVVSPISMGNLIAYYPPSPPKIADGVPEVLRPDAPPPIPVKKTVLPAMQAGRGHVIFAVISWRFRTSPPPRIELKSTLTEPPSRIPAPCISASR